MKIKGRHIAPLLMLSSALGAGGASAHDHGAHKKAPEVAQCLGLPVEKIAIQTYTFAKTLAGIDVPAEWDALPVAEKFQRLQPAFAKLAGAKPDSARLDGVLKEIAAIGYRNIEGMDLIGGDADAYAGLLRENGLQAVASHGTLDKAKWPTLLAEAKARGQRFIGSGGFGGPGLDTLDHVLETARNLNELGEAAAAEGLTLYVHNHTGEFDNRFPWDHGDGKPVETSAWEIIAANTDPRLVQFEIDVFWARLAFRPERFDDLLAFLETYRSRIALLHMKDLAPNGAVTDMGAGTTDWRRVVEAAGPQIAYYIYEFDFPSDPAKSAKIGFDYLHCGGGA
jgi:sugar phosphate isomerase/epimerase